ncbi:hypothetical protein BDO18943_05436 [Burkholderia dolosa]|nr:hypothetical protein BDO18943_05436 [Burkholderia dolosa]
MSLYVLPVSSTYCVLPSLPVTLNSALVVIPASFAAYTIGSTLTRVSPPPPIDSSLSRRLSMVLSLSLSVKRATSSFAGETGSAPADDGSPGTSGGIPSATPIRLRCSLPVSLPNAIVLPFCVLALAASSSEFDSSPRCAS